MSQNLYAGGDWSGTPDAPRKAVDIYSFCLAAFTDLDLLNQASEWVRLELGMKRDTEFHGHEMSDVMIAAVLEMALELDVRLGIVVINKAAMPLSGIPELPIPAQFAGLLALRLLRRFLPDSPIRKLWCDEDIERKTAQREFEGRVRTLNREVGNPNEIEVRFRDSKHSRLIQVPDVYAYAVTKQRSGTRLQPALENVLRKIQADPRHLILGPMPWENE